MAPANRPYDTRRGVDGLVDTLWTLTAALLVFLMHAGFGFFEAGMCREKNVVDALSHNVIILVVTIVIYWLIGFGFMFGAGNGIAGLSGFAPALTPDQLRNFPALAGKSVPLVASFAFALSFADTPATLIAGTGAERIRLFAVLVLATVISGLVFPLCGRWAIGDGWLRTAFPSFYDAGSVMIHFAGGSCALAVGLLLGPRRERFTGKKPDDAFAPSSLPMVFLGAFILWLGFIAFNAGLQMHLSAASALIAANVLIGSSTGALTALAGSWLATGKAQLRSVIVGLLTTNVAITTPCGVVEPWAAAVIGVISGGLAILSIRAFAALRIDDPTEYLTMNLVGGLIGALAAGLFASPTVLSGFHSAPAFEAGLAAGRLRQIGVELVGVVAIGLMAFVSTLLVCLALRSGRLLRVSAAEEQEGADVGTHGEHSQGAEGEREET